MGWGVGVAGKRVMEKKRAEEIITKAPEALLWTVAFVEMAKILQAILHANSEKRSLLVGMFFSRETCNSMSDTSGQDRPACWVERTKSRSARIYLGTGDSMDKAQKREVPREGRRVTGGKEVR